MLELLAGPKLLDKVVHGPEGADVVALARAVSLATFVEPGLLRRARLRLVPGAGAGVESLLWFSPLVQMRNRSGLTLRPEVAEELRWQLAETRDREYVARARQVVAAAHASYPPLLRLEEAIIWESVRHGSIAPPLDGVNTLCAQALRLMASDEATADYVAHWAIQAWPRLPMAARDTRAGHLLAVAASIRVRVPVDLQALSTPGESLAWLLPEPARVERVTLGVELTDDAVRFVEPGASALSIELPATTPLLVEVEWAAGAPQYGGLVPVGAGTEVPLEKRSGPVMLRTLAGRAYTLRDAEAVVETSPGGREERWGLDRLVRAARAGDERAWNELVRRFAPRLRAIGRAHRLQPAEVDDLVQLTWMRLITHVDSIRDPQAIGAWLQTTARRESLRLLSRRELPTDEALGHDVESADPAASELVGFAEQGDALRTAFRRLPQHERRLMELLTAHPHLSYDEIAERLDMPKGTIGPFRARALSRLRHDPQLARRLDRE